jgi:hypothetical protein
MVIMCVPVEELPRQAVMGRILILKCLLSIARGRPWACPVVSGIKYHRFLRTQLLWCLPGTKSPRAGLPGAQVCPNVIP